MNIDRTGGSRANLDAVDSGCAGGDCHCGRAIGYLDDILTGAINRDARGVGTTTAIAESDGVVAITRNDNIGAYAPAAIWLDPPAPLLTVIVELLPVVI